jgi:hypothetical protein
MAEIYSVIKGLVTIEKEDGGLVSYALVGCGCQYNIGKRYGLATFLPIQRGGEAVFWNPKMEFLNNIFRRGSLCKKLSLLRPEFFSGRLPWFSKKTGFSSFTDFFL